MYDYVFESAALVPVQRGFDGLHFCIVSGLFGSQRPCFMRHIGAGAGVVCRDHRT
jgi:hypothetical protein